MRLKPKEGKAEVFAQLRALEQPLREHGLASLALFGSFARGDARPDSDVDVLVEVVAEARFSLVDLVAVKDFLEDRLGRPVDVLMKEGLEPLIRDRERGYVALYSYEPRADVALILAIRHQREAGFQD